MNQKAEQGSLNWPITVPILLKNTISLCARSLYKRSVMTTGETRITAECDKYEVMGNLARNCTRGHHWRAG